MKGAVKTYLGKEVDNNTEEGERKKKIQVVVIKKFKKRKIIFLFKANLGVDKRFIGCL